MAKKRSNIAKNRARKKARKAVKRKAPNRQATHGRFAKYGCSRRDLESSPIHASYISSTIFDDGMGPVRISRELPNGSIACALFLVDIYCLGVKDAFLAVDWLGEYERKLHAFPGELIQVPAAYARKLVEEAVHYARNLGFEPHPDYREAAVLFGDIDPTECTEEFTFGRNGKPVYIGGPYDSDHRIQFIISQLERKCGPDGFSYLHADSTLPVDVVEDDDEWINGLTYNPDLAPDPDEWNEADEELRLEAVKCYHLAHAAPMPNVTLHSTFHVVVENQVKMMPEVSEALDRLMDEGLSRHDAIHAIASVISDTIYAAGKHQRLCDEAAYLQKVASLTADKWLHDDET